ncbi:MAG TPA: hypothetical protein VIY47_17220 [Ignavibacteriaceae bacterium]
MENFIPERVSDKFIVYKNGDYKRVKGINAWEYENDPNWLVTISIDDELLTP